MDYPLASPGGSMEEKTIHLQEGMILYQQGDEGRSMFQLRSGKIVLYLDHGTPKQFMLVEIKEPGTMFGEMGLLAEEPRTMTAVAMEDSDLTEIDMEHFKEFSRKHPDDMCRIITDLSRRLKTALHELTNAQEVVYGLIEEQETGQPRKDGFQQKLKRFTDLFFNYPKDVPPDVYLSNYMRNHGGML
ncbi:cyclic nucleotide-binding domain-containing protein [Parasphaerochaeta coccoides]|uniref:Transcriptional regulator, Crp/Fnr family n=1 Tax=Parasphaerochaeta coccoides (strain ATCC BAA-1237 / DSM 17374 / SPN1) TaxID=760011 RepID=F4GM50_PARC1|nr:cyclic nucleotide-binding domain-containing protein [Parasphaerochaeta coccoides]AEC02525.1 putative transcriptional regulator, Crp/Fnr family [Parasphaerochaeta coccoides DSM 17374]